MKKQIYKAQWFQYPNGTYLDIDTCFNSISKCEADSLEDAIEIFKEREDADSELYFEDRVSVWAVTTGVFYRVKYAHFGYATEDYSTLELAFERAKKRISHNPVIHEITEIGNPIALTINKLYKS